MDNKRLIIILSVWTVIFTLMGGTLAYWKWQSTDNRKTNVTFTVNRDYTCGADSGGHITSSDVKLAPAKCNDSVYAIKRPITTSVTTTGDKIVSLDLWLNINNISTNLTNTPNFKWAITKNGNTCSGVIKQGDFRNIQDNKIDLLDGVEYATLDDTYYLYIWLDEAETNSNTMNQSFDFSISGKCVDNGLEKALLKNLNTTDYFREDTYREKITDILFIYDKDLPSGVTTNNVKTYDLGANSNKPITGYLITNTDSGAAEDTYKLYVSSEYKIYAQNLQTAFQGMTMLKNISFNNFDTTLTTSISFIFNGCNSLTTLDLSNFNVANVTSTHYYYGGLAGMFQNCNNLMRLDLSNFDTSKAVKMNYMFSGCNSLIYLDISSFDTSNVTDMGNMFYNCSSLTELNVINFNTSNVTNMSRMFYGCSSLVTLNLSNWTNNKVTNMNAMFNGCNGLTSINLSNFNTSSVTDMGGMFSECHKLATLNLESFNTSEVTSMVQMFSNCRSLTMLDLTDFNTSNVTNMANMFLGCNQLVSLDLSSFNTSNVTSMYQMFLGLSNAEKIYVSELWNTDNVTNSFGMFTNCNKLPNITSVNDKTNAHYGEGGYLTYKAYNGN